MYDITNPSAPRVLGSYEYANQFCHNAWPSKDGNYAYISDEKPQRETDGMRVFDISDPGNIRQVNKFERGTDSDVIHNVEVEGDFAYISYYGLGVYIVDIRDPANPVEVDSYDPLPSTRRTGLNGTWGVQATKGPLVFASDRDRGLVILEWDRPDTRITGRD